jgi:YVTN family beta-propeller protein
MHTLMSIRNAVLPKLWPLVASLCAWLLPAGVGAEPFAYVANRTGNTVSVVDGASNTLTATIAVGANPWGIAVNATGSRVYTANQGANNVSVIDTASNTVTATIAMGNQPLGIAVNPSGTRVYVGNYSDNTVKVIDTSSNTVVATIPVGNGPIGIAVNPAGTRVYVANSPGSSVSVIDTGTNTVTATVPVGNGPVGIAINPAGTRVYTANSNTNNISVIDTATNTVTTSIAAGTAPRGISINPAGTRAYVANQTSQDVTVIDLGSNTVVTAVPMGGVAPYGLSVNPTGTAVYVAIQTGNVKVIETAGNTVSATVASAGGKVSLGNFFAAPPAAVATPTDPIPPLSGLPAVTGIGTQPTVLDLASGDGPTMTNCLMDSIRALLGADATYLGQTTNGVARVSLSGGRALAFYPLQASTSANVGIGLHPGTSNVLNVGTRCGNFNVVPALYNLADFGTAVAGLGLTASITPQGVLTLLAGDTVYVARPDFFATLGASTALLPSLARGSDGLYRLTDSTGTVQVLHPAFLDTDALAAQSSQALNQVGTTAIQTDGTALFQALGGQMFNLLPELTLTPATADNAGLLWWRAGPSRFVFRGSTLVQAQGFSAVPR